jgi:hypothetical protein
MPWLLQRLAFRGRRSNSRPAATPEAPSDAVPPLVRNGEVAAPVEQ